MIVEDEAVIALRLEHRLTEVGYEVVGTFHSGEAAVENARRLLPDLILMDIMIPGDLDGIDAAKIVREELDIPVIFLTAYSDDKFIERAKKAEPYGYLVKPTRDRELKATIEIALYKKKFEKALRESEEYFKALAENANDGILIATGDSEFVYANRRMAEMAGYSVSELLKTTMDDLVHPNEIEKIKERYRTIIAGKPFQRQCEATLIRKDGAEVPLEVTSTRLIWYGQPSDLVIFRDITEHKMAEEALKTSHNALEYRVEERTIELETALKGIALSEKELNQRKLALEEVNRQLLETNQALSVLARNIDKDKEMLEQRIYKITSSKIMPIVKELQEDESCSKRQAELEVLSTHLNNLTISSALYNEIDTRLTDQEMRVVVMIKNGLSSQQIGDLLCISLHTVKTHRKNIRKKLKIDNTDINLVSYLKSKMVSDPMKGNLNPEL